MRRFFFVLLALSLIPRVSLAQTADAGEPLSVMTFNLRYAGFVPPNDWPARRPATRDCIRQVNPDVIGTQEGLYLQIKDVAADLPDYEWIGLGREGGSRGEFMAVFYKRDRLEPVAFDHFWLSDTPAVMGSATWGNKVVRMVTWVRFRDLKTKQEFYFVNTHLDHQVQESREKSASLIRRRVEQLAPQLPVVLVGDFNAAAKSNRVYDILTDGEFFQDTWFTAKRQGESIGTFHNYKGPRKEGTRIDWILTRGPVAVDSTEVVTFSRDGQYPSDHFPVAATLRLLPGK